MDNHSRYWVASRCVMFDNTNAYFNAFIVRSGNVESGNLYYSTGYKNIWNLAVRPMVDVDLDLVNVGQTGTGTNTDPYSMAKK